MIRDYLSSMHKSFEDTSRRIRYLYSLFQEDRIGKVGLFILLFFTVLGVFGPLLAPHDPWEMNRDSEGELLRTAGPMWEHPFGTTNLGRDIFSQFIIGARVSLIVGCAAAFIAVFIGANIGIISAYYGGYVDDFFMRITDIVYGLPFLPVAIVMVFILGEGLWAIVLVIGIIQWRGVARVVRSEVLTQKERPYVKIARAAGAGHLRVMYIHILPNVLPLISLYTAFAVAWAVIAEAGISFLGFGDPDAISWGQMMHDLYTTGAIRFAWWWLLPPGLAIMLFVMAVFFIGRALEKVTDPTLEGKV